MTPRVRVGAPKFKNTKTAKRAKPSDFRDDVPVIIQWLDWHLFDKRKAQREHDRFVLAAQCSDAHEYARAAIERERAAQATRVRVDRVWYPGGGPVIQGQVVPHNEITG